MKNTLFGVYSRVNFCGDEFNLYLAIFALMPIMSVMPQRN